MGKVKEKTVVQLLRETTKLEEECQETCVLKGEVKMRGPGRNDPPDDEETIQPSIVQEDKASASGPNLDKASTSGPSLDKASTSGPSLDKASTSGPSLDDPGVDIERIKICGSCEHRVLDSDLNLCILCKGNFHSSCLQPLSIASSIVDLVCSQCHSSSLPLQPVEACSLNSPPAIGGEHKMTCVVGSQWGSQGRFPEDLALPFSLDPSCQRVKSVQKDDGLKIEDDSVRSLDQAERSSKGAIEGSTRRVYEEVRTCDLVCGESSEQAAPVPENVRRSKRGKPYIAPGGLHPNKRRSTDKSKKPTDKLHPIDEEDELGAPIGKYQTMSSIDKKLETKVGPAQEKNKEGSTGGPTMGNLGEIEAGKSVALEQSGEVGSPLVRGTYDNKVSCDANLKSPLGIGSEELRRDTEVGEGAALRKDDTEERQTEPHVGHGRGNSLAADQFEGQKIPQTRYTQDTITQMGNEEERGGVALRDLALPDTPNRMSDGISIEDPLVVDPTITFKRALHPVSSGERVESSGNPLQVLSKISHIGDAQLCDRNGELLQQTGSMGHESEKKLRTMVSQVESRAGKRDSEDEQEQHLQFLTGDLGKKVRSHDSQSDPLFVGRDSDDIHSMVEANDTAASEVEECREVAGWEELHGRSKGDGQTGALRATVTQAGDSCLQGLVKTGEVLSAKESIGPIASIADRKAGPGLIQLTIAVPSALTDPSSASTTTDPDSNYPHHLSSPTCLVQGKVQLKDSPPELEVGQGSTFGARDTTAICVSKKQSNIMATGESDCTIEAPPDSTSVLTTKILSNGGSKESTLVVAQDVPSSRSLLLDVNGGVSFPQEQADGPPLQSEQQTVSLSCGNLVQSGPDLSAWVVTDKVGGGVVPPPRTATVRSVPACVGRSSDKVAEISCKGEQPGVSKNRSSQEKLEVKSSQSAHLEEEDSVKVCDICGDAGYEECLAICSACSEGAEHIYCMQATLDKVPEDGWLCESCASKEKAGNLKQVEIHPLPRIPMALDRTMSKRKQVLKSNTRSRLSACLEKGKGSLLRKGATRGPPNYQFSTKRPIDDSATAPAAKRPLLDTGSVLFNGTGSTVTPRMLSKENSFKSAESGKVKFLSQNTLASTPVGGFRSSGKLSGSLGLFPSFQRPGLSQVSQVGNKNNYAPSNGTPATTEAMGSASAPKPPLMTPRPSTLYGTATPLGGRGAGSMKEAASSYLPVRPVSTPRASKEASCDGNGPHSLGRDTAVGSQLTAAIGKGWSSAMSGQPTTKLLDIPRRPTQLTGMQYSMTQTVGCAPSPEGTGITSRTLTSQKSSMGLDPPKNLTRTSSLNRLSNVQLSKREPQASSEHSNVKDLKTIESSAAVIPSVTSVPLPTPAQGANSVPAVIQKAKVLVDPKLVAPKSPGRLGGDGQGNVVCVLQDEDVKQASKVSMRCPPSSKPLAMVTTASKLTKELSGTGRDLKFTDSVGRSWPTLNSLGSIQGSRCYKCKEMGHTAQTCSSRSTVNSILADVAIASSETPASLKSPKEGLQSSGSTAWKLSLGEQKHSVPSIDPVTSTLRKKLELVDSRLVPESSVDSRQVLHKSTVAESPEVSVKVVDDARKQGMPSVSFSRSLDIPKTSGFGADPWGPIVDLQAILSRKDKVSNRVSNKVSNTIPTPGLAIPFSKELPTSLPLNQVRHPAGVPVESLTTGVAFKDGKQIDVEIASNKQAGNLNEAGQACSQGITVATGRSIPPAVSLRPLEPPFPTPSMTLSSKSLGTGSQVAPRSLPVSLSPLVPSIQPPRPMFAVDRMVNQDGRPMRVAVGTPNGVGTPTSYGLGSNSPAVPMAQCLWRGGFDIISAAAVPAFYDGLQGFSSSCAAPKVREVSKTLPTKLQLEEVRRMFNAEAWPKQFQLKPPTDKEIALYFFPDSDSAANFEEGYTRLLEHMMGNDLVLMGHVEGAEILIFSSHLLPLAYHCWKGKKFLWGVYRAKRAPPSATLIPLASTQVAVDSCLNVVVSGQGEQPPGTVVPQGQLENVISSGTAMDSTSDGGNGAEVDMEIDMIGDKDLCVQQRSARKSGWDWKGPLISPPLPPEPPPVQPPPPTPLAVCELKQNTADTGPNENAPKACISGQLDLPPGFGPSSQKQLLHGVVPPGLDDSPVGPLAFQQASACPPGFGKGQEGVLPAVPQAIGIGGQFPGSAPDVPMSNQVQGWPRRESNAADSGKPSTSSRQTSPILPSPTPRDSRDNVFTVNTPTQRNSRSSSESSRKPRGRTQDRSSSRPSFRERESERARERLKDRERYRFRDREQGQDQGSRLDRERRRERGYDRESERDTDRVHGRSRDHRNRDRDRVSERKSYRRSHAHSRSRSPSQSRSRSYSSPRRSARSQARSRSLSPIQRRSSGSHRSRHRFQSDSISSGSDTERLSRRQSRDRSLSQPGAGTSTEVGAQRSSQDADRQPERALEMSKLPVLAGAAVQPEIAARMNRVADQNLNELPYPFSDITHQGVEEDGEEKLQNSVDEIGDRALSVPQYHLFLPAESESRCVLGSDAASAQSFFPKIWPSSPGAITDGETTSSAIKEILFTPPTGPEIQQQSSGAWDLEKAESSSGYQFFPLNTGTVSRSGWPRNPNLDLALGEKDQRETQQLRPLPLFVSQEDTKLLTGSRNSLLTVTDPQLRVPVVPEATALNLTLSVPQYRREGSSWVRLDDSMGPLGEDDLNFALTL